MYEPSDNGAWYLIRRPAQYNDKITIGIYNEHTFFIKNINKLANIYCCGSCNGRFTQACHLQRHAKICLNGVTKVLCPNEQLCRPTSAYEKAFYPNYGKKSIKMASQWLEYEAQQRGIHIHYDGRGHAGERYINNIPVDGISSKTFFQFHGCTWHGFPQHSTQSDAIEPYKKTLEVGQKIRDAGYNLVVMWQCDAPKICKTIKIPDIETQQYPHAIVFDFESYLDKTKCYSATKDLIFENKHTPISVSIGDTFDSTPTHIVSEDPKDLVTKFVNEINRRAEYLRDDVRKKYIPEDFDMLPKKIQRTINEWCNQIPVLGYNSGRYDLNLIKNHFVSELSDKCTVKVGKKGNETMFMITPELRFLDVMNYLGPGTSYDKWVKAYGCTLIKSFLPYEWFDSSEKLKYPGLPDYTE